MQEQINIKNEVIMNEDRKTLREKVQAVVEDYLSNDGDFPASKLYKIILAEIENPIFKEVMRHIRDNKAKAVVMLGMNRATWRKKLGYYDINYEGYKR